MDDSVPAANTAWPANHGNGSGPIPRRAWAVRQKGGGGDTAGPESSTFKSSRWLAANPLAG